MRAPRHGTPLRVVVVDDSPTQLAALVRLVEGGGDMAVVGTAHDVAGGLEVLARERPDAATVDLEMPGGGGTALIRQVMAETPVPVLVLSGVIAGREAAAAVEALAAGAVDAAPKPERWDGEEAEGVRRRLRRVATVPVVRRRPGGSAPRPAAAAPRAPAAQRPGPIDDAIVGIVASTGGPEAVVTLLTALRGVDVPVLLVQHIHAAFAEGLAAWLTRATGWPTRTAAAGTAPRRGTVDLAAPGAHLVLDGTGRLACPVQPASAAHRPSGDVLLASLAERAGARAVGVVLTGMGDDGARGLLAIREAGGTTLAQDEQSSVVFGMPRAAAGLGAAGALLAPAAIAAEIRRRVRASGS